MVKFPSITLSEGATYVIIANALLNVGLPGTYIVYAKGNPKVLYKMLRSEGILDHDLYYQLENLKILKNHSKEVVTIQKVTLYKYERTKNGSKLKHCSRTI